jgi:two-component system chemotaxis response regulator CheB
VSGPNGPSGDGDQAPFCVLVVDDSAVVREVLTRILATDPKMSVVSAPNPIIALEKMKRRRPNVIVLDLDMPHMDGISFLKRIMAEDPIPVVVCSALDSATSHAPMQALDCGAVEVIRKPRIGLRGFLEESAVMVLDAVRGAARARLRPRGLPAPALAPAASAPHAFSGSSTAVVAVGASTGGTDAICTILQVMPVDCPPLAIVQHMPEGFTAQFAARLDECCRVQVKEAADGDRLVRGRALIAPGNRHMRVHGKSGRLVVELGDGLLVSRHRPSVDVLFHSVAAAVGPNAVGVLLTGMGDDGADGLLAMRRAGAHTIAQDEASCAVFGMPKEAIARGAVDDVATLRRIPNLILEGKRRLHATGPRRR